MQIEITIIATIEDDTDVDSFDFTQELMEDIEERTGFNIEEIHVRKE